MIDPKKEQFESLLDRTAAGKLSRRDLLARASHASGAGAPRMPTPEALVQAATAGEVQAANRAALKKRYDYIVVGAGSTGCAAARRILDNTNATVLVIEAGSDERGIPAIDDPTRWVENIHSKRDWGYFYTPSEATMKRKILLSRGKVLGGSSSVNALVWLRGAGGPTRVIRAKHLLHRR